MFENVIYTNEHIQLIIEDEHIYVKALQKGYNIQQFNEILKNFPRIKLTEFTALKSALAAGHSKIVKIGDLRPVVEISVSGDRLKAFALINMTQSEFNETDKKTIVEKILVMANQSGIVYGIEIQDLVKSMQVKEKFKIASGLVPVKGDDAIITYYEIKELQPEVFQDGKVNHYELNLINKVERGDWVGERIEPTPGIPGKTVYGEVIPAQQGRQEQLKYDRKSIEEVPDGKGFKTTIIARQVGAVIFENDVISVCNFLEVEGRVSFETGNIDFDGFVEVKDSIEDNFSVIAENDIQIMGQIGVGGVDTIESKDGNVYIRGGIAGKNKAKIICNGDLYTKFAADCVIEAKGTVNIGYYAMNCEIRAKEVILESYSSKIIGGSIDAQIRVIAGDIGSKAEIYTKINVSGFDRTEMKEQYDQINMLIDKSKERINFLKQQLGVYDINNLEPDQREIFHKIEEDYQKNKKNLKMFYDQRKKYISYLQTKGEGEITASKKMYPNVHMHIRGIPEHVMDSSNLPKTFYYHNGELIED